MKKTLLKGLMLISICLAGHWSLLSRPVAVQSATVPMILDHNRMLVDAAVRKPDGSWRKVRLWVDSGYALFCLSEPLARDLGIDLTPAQDPSFQNAQLPVTAPSGLRLGDMDLDLDQVPTAVVFKPFWFFSTMQIDGNLPASVLRKYRVVFDYPRREMTLAQANDLMPKGSAVPLTVHPESGIARVEASIDKERVGLALDVGASYSLVSEADLLRFAARHPDWPIQTGTLGHANLWGWWPPNEQEYPVLRAAEIVLGEGVVLRGVGMVGVKKFASGLSWGDWYAHKTDGAVIGLLGPNALKAYRLEIDYQRKTAYFEKGGEPDCREMEMVGISVRPLADGTYQVVGIVQSKGQPAIEGIRPDDVITAVDGAPVQGKTMGAVVDMLRGRPGEKRFLDIIRDGKPFRVELPVKHFL